MVIQSGYVPAVMVYVVSALLGFLILPDKAPLAFYGLFFGYYPIVKSVAEKIRNRVLSWCVKLVVFNAALTVMFVFFKELLMLIFFDKLSGNVLGIVVYIAFNIIFVVYDFGMSKLIGFYLIRIHNKFR